MHPKPFKPVLPYESTIPTYMRYFYAVLSKFACAISNFQNKFLFCVLVPLARWWGMANIFYPRCVILKMSVYSLVIAREYRKGIRDAQSRNEKWIYFMLSNNKFLEKCWYGRHPWIRLAMKSESVVEKGITLFSAWEPPMIYLGWEVLGTTRSFSLIGKACHPKCFISGASTNPDFPPRRAFLLLYAIFIFNLSLHLIL